MPDYGQRVISTAAISSYLIGMSFPASRDQIVDYMEDREAPDELVDFMEKLPDRRYETVGEVLRRAGKAIWGTGFSRSLRSRRFDTA